MSKLSDVSFERVTFLEIVRSRNNKLLKHGKKLNIRKYRQEDNEFLIEGLRFVEEAVAANADIKYCIFSENLKGDRASLLLDKMRSKKIDTYMVEDKLINEICDTKTPQGIAAVVKRHKINEDSIISDSNFLLIVDRLQDPGNLGTIIRTAHAAGIGGIIISSGTVDPYSPKVLRSTMGSIFNVPIIEAFDLSEIIHKIRGSGFTIYASSPSKSVPYWDEAYASKVAIIIGNEANGIDQEVIAQSDRQIKIPMPGGSESLNASVACGILAFEVLRQRAAAQAAGRCQHWECIDKGN